MSNLVTKKAKGGFDVSAESGVSLKVIHLCKYWFSQIQKAVPINNIVGVRLLNKTSQHQHPASQQFHNWKWLHECDSFIKDDTHGDVKFSGLFDAWNKGYLSYHHLWLPIKADCMIYISAKIFRRNVKRSWAIRDLIDTIYHEASHYLNWAHHKKDDESNIHEQATGLFIRSTVDSEPLRKQLRYR